jgi:hypothetical protein
MFDPHPRHEPLFDTHPVTYASLEVFYANPQERCCWFWWQRRRKCAPERAGAWAFLLAVRCTSGRVEFAGWRAR